MRFDRALHALTSWIAALAILMAALAPSISHALQGRPSGLWIEICSSMGSKVVDVADLDASQPVPPSSLLHSLEHCPYCALQFGANAPPSTSVSVVLLPFIFAVPQLFLAAPYTLFAWHHAPSHGPPFIA